jgi:ribosomal protein L37AE/L43A
MDKTIVLCPFCDKEQSIRNEKQIAKCDRCGKPFNNDIFADMHPNEFWANPDTSVRF